MAPTIRYKPFPWPGQRRPCDERLEHRARALIERQGWEREGPPGRSNQRLRRQERNDYAEALTISCSRYGDRAWLTLRGGPWVPPGYRARRLYNTPHDRGGLDRPNVVTPLGYAFVVSPLEGFADVSSPLSDALSRSRAEGVGPDAIAWRAVDVPMTPGDEGLRLIATYIDACRRDAESWAAATKLFLRSHRYR